MQSSTNVQCIRTYSAFPASFSTQPSTAAKMNINFSQFWLHEIFDGSLLSGNERDQQLVLEINAELQKLSGDK